MENSKEQNELIFSHSFNENAPPELQAESFSLRQFFSSSIHGVCWFLGNLPFARETTYICAFQCFNFRLENFPEEFTPEILGNLMTFLFQHSMQNISNFSPPTAMLLCETQVKLSIYVFPELFPNLFASVFQYPDILKYHFLASFCEILILPNPQNIERFNIVKISLDQINFYGQILPQIHSGIQQKIPDAVSTLSSFTRWSKNLDFLGNTEFINMLFSDSSEELAIVILRFIKSIAQRSIPPELKGPLIEASHFINRVHHYIENFSQNLPLIQECAETSYTLAFSSLIPLEVLYEDMVFYLNQPPEISEKSFGYFALIVRRNPGVANDIVVKVVKRMIDFFGQGPVTTFVRFINQLLSLLFECFKVNPDSFYNGYRMLFSSISESNISDNMEQFSALMAISNLMFMRKIPFIQNESEDYLSSFFRISFRLLSLQPPIAPNVFFPLYGFLRTFIYRNDNIANQYNQDVIKQLSALSIDENLPDEARNSIQVLFLNYVMKKNKSCSKVTDFIDQFFSKPTKELMNILALALNGIPGTSKLRIERSVRALEIINNAILGETVNYDSASLSLSFLSVFKSQTVEIASMEISILQRISPFCFQNDKLFGELIKATSSVGTNGFPLFQECLGNISGPYSISAIAIATIEFLNMFRDNEDISKFLLQVPARLIEIFISATQQVLSGPLSKEENVKILGMCDSCYKVFSQCSQFISGQLELIGNLLGFTKVLIVKKFGSASLLASIYSFLSSVSQNNAPAIIDQFAAASFFFIFDKGFDPNKKEWEMLLTNLRELHSNLMKFAYQKFTSVLSEVFHSFGISDEFVQNYNLAIEKDLRSPDYKQFFVNILAVRNSMTW